MAISIFKGARKCSCIVRLGEEWKDLVIINSNYHDGHQWWEKGTDMLHTYHELECLLIFFQAHEFYHHYYPQMKKLRLNEVKYLAQYQTAPFESNNGSKARVLFLIVYDSLYLTKS